jgi:hypothetical protein
MAGRRTTETKTKKPKAKAKVPIAARSPKARARAKSKAKPAAKKKAQKAQKTPKTPKTPKAPKARKANPLGTPSARRLTTPARPVEAPRPSERALATAAQIPIERPLSDEERAAMMKVAETARRHLYSALGPAGAVRSEVSADGVPQRVVERIASFVEEVRLGARPEPQSQDVKLGLGVLWGEQVRAQVGWTWVHLTYADGFASYALVPDDRAFACFPLNRVPEAMKQDARTNTTAAVFASIREGILPTRKPNAYLVIG